MSPRGGGLNGSTIPRQMFLAIELSVSVTAEFSAPERCEEEQGTAEQSSGCSRGAGTGRAAALLVLTRLQHSSVSAPSTAGCLARN